MSREMGRPLMLHRVIPTAAKSCRTVRPWAAMPRVRVRPDHAEGTWVHLPASRAIVPGRVVKCDALPGRVPLVVGFVRCRSSRIGSARSLEVAGMIRMDCGCRVATVFMGSRDASVIMSRMGNG